MNMKLNMNAAVIAATYAVQIEAIASALAGKAGAAADATLQGGTVSAKLRELATTTAKDGVDAGEARAALKMALESATLENGNPAFKAGTVKASGNHFAGYRAMIAADIDIETGKKGNPYTVADAQDFIA